VFTHATISCNGCRNAAEQSTDFLANRRLGDCHVRLVVGGSDGHPRCAVRVGTMWSESQENESGNDCHSLSSLAATSATPKQRYLSHFVIIKHHSSRALRQLFRRLWQHLYNIPWVDGEASGDDFFHGPQPCCVKLGVGRILNDVTSRNGDRIEHRVEMDGDVILRKDGTRPGVAPGNLVTINGQRFRVSQQKNRCKFKADKNITEFYVDGHIPPLESVPHHTKLEVEVFVRDRKMYDRHNQFVRDKKVVSKILEGQVDEWDITTLYWAFTKSSHSGLGRGLLPRGNSEADEVATQVRKGLDAIREQRNAIAHGTELTLAVEDFKKHMTSLTHALRSIDRLSQVWGWKDWSSCLEVVLRAARSELQQTSTSDYERLLKEALEEFRIEHRGSTSSVTNINYFITGSNAKVQLAQHTHAFGAGAPTMQVPGHQPQVASVQPALPQPVAQSIFSPATIAAIPRSCMGFSSPVIAPDFSPSPQDEAWQQAFEGVQVPRNTGDERSFRATQGDRSPPQREVGGPGHSSNFHMPMRVRGRAPSTYYRGGAVMPPRPRLPRPRQTHGVREARYQERRNPRPRQPAPRRAVNRSHPPAPHRAVNRSHPTAPRRAVNRSHPPAPRWCQGRQRQPRRQGIHDGPQSHGRAPHFDHPAAHARSNARSQQRTRRVVRRIDPDTAVGLLHDGEFSLFNLTKLLAPAGIPVHELADRFAAIHFKPLFSPHCRGQELDVLVALAARGKIVVGKNRDRRSAADANTDYVFLSESVCRNDGPRKPCTKPGCKFVHVLRM